MYAHGIVVRNIFRTLQIAFEVAKIRDISVYRLEKGERLNIT